MYRDLTGIRMNRDDHITVFDSIPAIPVVPDLKLTGNICYNNRQFNPLLIPQIFNVKNTDKNNVCCFNRENPLI